MQHRIQTDLEQADFTGEFKGFNNATLTGAQTGIMFAFGATVPSDADEGFGKGCLFLNTALSSESDALYVNIGSHSSANFNAVTVAGD